MSNVNFCALMELVDLYFCFEIIGHFSKPKEEFFNSDDMYPPRSSSSRNDYCGMLSCFLPKCRPCQTLWSK